MALLPAQHRLRLSRMTSAKQRSGWMQVDTCKPSLHVSPALRLVSTHR
jgi:hypothetical protein